MDLSTQKHSKHLRDLIEDGTNDIVATMSYGVFTLEMAMETYHNKFRQSVYGSYQNVIPSISTHKDCIVIYYPDVVIVTSNRIESVPLSSHHARRW
jgi:hypothetical protein